MPGGDGFTAVQRHQIDKAIRDAETVCRYEFSVFVGRVDGDARPYAERLHASLTAPDRSVLILVDPGARALEVVTGSVARRELEDREVTMAVVGMQAQFADGDLVGGIVRGIQRLAAYARKPRTLHA